MAEEEGTALTNEPTPTDTSSNTWREALPEEIREAGALKDIPDVNTLANHTSTPRALSGDQSASPAKTHPTKSKVSSTQN